MPVRSLWGSLAGLMAQGTGLRAQGTGLRAQGSGCRGRCISLCALPLSRNCVVLEDQDTISTSFLGSAPRNLASPSSAEFIPPGAGLRFLSRFTSFPGFRRIAPQTSFVNLLSFILGLPLTEYRLPITLHRAPCTLNFFLGSLVFCLLSSCILSPVPPAPDDPHGVGCRDFVQPYSLTVRCKFDPFR